MYGHSGPNNSTNPDKLPLSSIDFNKIFFSGEFENTLFIDFEAVLNPIVTVSLFQREKVLMLDRVEDLPTNTIYELNLEIIRPGDYVLEIVTIEGIKIQKDIRVE